MKRKSKMIGRMPRALFNKLTGGEIGTIEQSKYTATVIWSFGKTVPIRIAVSEDLTYCGDRYDYCFHPIDGAWQLVISVWHHSYFFGKNYYRCQRREREFTGDPVRFHEDIMTTMLALPSSNS